MECFRSAYITLARTFLGDSFDWTNYVVRVKLKKFQMQNLFPEVSDHGDSGTNQLHSLVQ